MEDSIKVLLILCLVLIVVLLTVILFMSYLLVTKLNKKDLEVDRPQAPKQIPRAMCTLHPYEHSHGICSICSEHFCEKCLSNNEGLNFCKEHFSLLTENEWDEVITIKTSPNNPESGVAIYELHKDKWKKEQIPSYVVTHYKINFEDDSIESYVKLYCLEKDIDLFKTLVNNNIIQ